MQPAPLSRPRPPVLEVENLSVSFRVDGQWPAVVRDVSFEVAPGETLAIVGESGSGKSVTSLAIMRLLPPGVSRVEGRIALNGTDILSIPDNRMREVRGRDVAMIFQEPMTSLNPLFTVGDQISEAILCHNRIPKAEAVSEALGLLERVRIPDARLRLAEYPHRLSGGMRQRVMIAMALASRASMLIADEPTTALDVTIQGQILDLIKSIQAETGMSVLFITHDMGVVAEISDRTLVMFRGDHVETGTTAEVFRHPRADYTRHLLAAVPVLGSMSGKPGPEPFPLGAEALDRQRAAAPKTWSEPARPEPAWPETDGGRQVGLPIGEGAGGARRPLLQARNLCKRFDVRGGVMSRLRGRVHAVEDVSFDLYPGETLSLVGESGCGKSTTGRLLLRLIEADGGSARIGDTDVLTGGPSEMRAMRRAAQMIFQDPFASLDPSMTVGDAIAEPWLEHGYGTRSAARTRVAELLQQVGLPPEVRDRYPHEFSGGQRQRICIARALALEPKFIVADESVSALDVTVKGQICNLLLELQEKLGVAYLFISHDMAVVERISHRVAVMYLGRIVEIGPRQAVFDSPLHPYTRKLLAAVPVADPDRRHLTRGLIADEIRSPIRAPGYRPDPSLYTEVSPGHFVLADTTGG